MRTNNSVDDTSKNLEETNISDDVKELREEKRRSRKDKIRQRRIESKKWVRESSFFAKVKKAMPFSKVIGKIFMIYLFTVLFTGFLLMIPGIISESGSAYNWDYISGIFNASAALSDTGIVTAPVWSTYTFWGQLILLILFQLGGIGVLTIKITLLIMLNRKISVNDQITAQTERGGIALSNTTEMIKDAFVFLIIVEIIGSFVLFFGFYFIEVPSEVLEIKDDHGVVIKTIGQSPFRNFEMSLWFSIFHSVSAVNNAGMDIFSDNSLQGYNTSPYGYSIQSVFLIQWVIGGLGYPTYHDVKKKIRAMRTGEHVQFSLFTKLNFTVYSALFFVGPLLVFFTELSSGTDSNILYSHDPTGAATAVSWHKGLFDIVFNVSASRNAGFTTIDIRNMNEGSRIVLSTLMFIGSAPSSTAGGIRTTTFAILLILCWSVIRNKKSVSAFSKTIPQDTVRKSMAVFVVSMILSVSMIFIIYVDSYNQAIGGTNNFNMTDIMVLVFSAFGTVGFSPYNTHAITSFGMVSKFALIITMFIGQLGISNTLLAFVKPSSKERFKYLEQDVMIG